MNPVENTSESDRFSQQNRNAKQKKSQQKQKKCEIEGVAL